MFIHQRQRLLGLIFSMLLFVACPCFALAADFELFNMDIPDTWTQEVQGKTHTFTNKDGQCSINITVAHHQGSSFNELGIMLYQALKGMTPKGDDDGFSFAINTNSEVISKARLTYRGENLVFVVASGACPNFEHIVTSLSLKDGGPRPYPTLDPKQTK